MSCFFISDLHLSENNPHLTEKFFEFIKTYLKPKDELYILGDFFNFWIGKDCASDYHFEILNALKQLSDKSIVIYVMVGNRDFLLEPKFLQHFSIHPIPDPYVTYMNQKRILMSHGDLWCTDNKSYQRFRKIVRSKSIITLFRCLPRKLRLYIANRLRAHSTQRNYRIIEDINLSAINKAELGNIEKIIHGHTHNPILQLLYEQNDYKFKRICLADWNKEANAYRIDDKDQEDFIYF